MKTLLFFTLDARQTAARIVYVFLTATLFILICFSLRTAAPIPLTGNALHILQETLSPTGEDHGLRAIYPSSFLFFLPFFTGGSLQKSCQQSS